MKSALTQVIEGILACADHIGIMPERYYVYPEEYCQLIRELLLQGCPLKSHTIPELNIDIIGIPVCPYGLNQETMQ
jgi:hypothetical protein